MGISIGDENLKNAYIGSNSLKSVYEGQELVRPDNSYDFDTYWDNYEIIYSGSNGTIKRGYNADNSDGEIQLKKSDSTEIIIQDRNLGATTNYTLAAGLSEANCGKYYQRGNNYGFAWSGSVTTSGAQVNASSYGPGNYYSSSTFIYGNRNWDSSNNNNLWGDTTDTEEARQGPAPEGYHVPTTNELQALWSLVQAITGATTGAQLSQYCLLPFAGFRHYSNARVNSQGDEGYYWSSSPYSATSYYARYLYLYEGAVYADFNDGRSYGFSVRCFRNSYGS